MGFSGSGITFTGLASGIDTESIIARLISLERRPIQRLLVQQAELRLRLGATEQYRALIQALRSATLDLNEATAFKLMKATSSRSDVATATATISAQPGSYILAISKLAQANKLASAGQSSSTAALGLSGKFLLNGKAVEVFSGDSLSAIATKVNVAGAGVTASVISNGAGSFFLVFSASDSGKDNAIALSDVSSGTVLGSLGFLTGSASVRRPITNGAEGIGLRDSTTAVGTLLGISVPPGLIKINGLPVAVDFATDSLTDIANKINAGVPGVTASVVTRQKGGQTVYALTIVGTLITPIFSDANNMLENLGILQRAHGNELLVAQDAAFTLDGLPMTRPSNTFSDAITGVTLTLLKANASSPETTTITVTRDTEAMRKKVEKLAEAYNAVLDFLRTAASFDKETLESGPLFGDSTVGLIQDLVDRGLLQSPVGISGPYRNLLAIGIGFDRDGRMTVDAAKFDEAIGTNLDNVRALFQETGRSEDPDISFVTATSKTKPSGAAGYQVNITQLATFGSHTAGVAQLVASIEQEVITFGGALFGNTPYALTVPSGSTIDSLIMQINSDPRLRDLVTATKVSGKLVLTSKKYGSPGSFTVASNLIAAPNNSGIGTTVQTAAGLDVAGTINGEAATGSGQYLTGNAGNENTEGLTLLVAGGSTGNRGAVFFTRGAAAVIERALNSALDVVNGFITAATGGIQHQIDDIEDRIEALEESLKRREEQLRRQFTAMEDALARLQAQSAHLASLVANLNAFSSRR